MEILFLLVPFITTAIMQGIKKLAGLFATDNGPGERVWLRTMLVALSFFGVVATSLLNGTPIDANTVSDLVKTLLGTALTAYLSHAFYRSAARA